MLALRLFNVYGPLQAAGHAYAAVIPTWVDAALRGLPLVVHGDGRTTRDFTYVGSVVAVLADAALRRVSDPEPVNLAFGTRTSLMELIDGLGEALGWRPEVVHGPTRPGDVRHSQADGTRLSELFPGVRPVPLATGLAGTVEWSRRQQVAGSPARPPLARGGEEGS